MEVVILCEWCFPFTPLHAAVGGRLLDVLGHHRGSWVVEGMHWSRQPRGFAARQGPTLPPNHGPRHVPQDHQDGRRLEAVVPRGAIGHRTPRWFPHPPLREGGRASSGSRTKKEGEDPSRAHRFFFFFFARPGFEGRNSQSPEPVNTYKKHRPSLNTSCIDGTSPSTPGAAVSSRDVAKLRAAVHARRHRHR